jgi:hypothetical protein
MRSSTLAMIFLLAGCATSSQELSQQADAHMSNARGAAATGNPSLARAEQRKAEKYYQRAVDRAYQDNQLPPPPPSDAPLPIFDPQMQH